ncbi:MAG: hypothetical protein ACTSWI_03300 [Alphaproteobacteria bacterium]
MFQRGSIPWFIAHDIKLTWRSWSRRKGRKRRLGVPAPVIAVAILVVATLAMGLPARSLQDEVFVATPLASVLIDGVLLLVFTLMLSQTLVGAVDAFYDRGDLDLLLSSPIPPTRVLAMRAIAMALQPFLLFAGIATPFVLPLAVFGHPGLLGVYVVVASLALMSTAIGLLAAIGLFTAIGPRRTRTVAQILAAVVGALFVIAAQVPNLLGVGDDEPVTAGWVVALMDADRLPGIVTFPAEAFLGALGPLLMMVSAGLALFAGVALWVGRRFARNAAAASGADTIRTRKGRQVARFGGSMMRVTVSKELRLLLRDAALISQILLRVFYLVPLGFIILADSGDSVSLMPALVAAAASLLAGQMAGSVAWITISAEDSPELLASAPYPIRDFWRAKLAVSLMVPGVFIVPLMIVFAFLEPMAAAIGIVAAAASAWSAAMINLWLQKPAKRAEYRRSWSTTFAANMLELVTSVCFAVFALLAVFGLAYSAIPATIAAVILLLSRRSEVAVLERATGTA